MHAFSLSRCSSSIGGKSYSIQLIADTPSFTWKMATRTGSLNQTVIAKWDILQEKIEIASPTQTTLNGHNLDVATVVVAVARFVKSGLAAVGVPQPLMLLSSSYIGTMAASRYLKNHMMPSMRVRGRSKPASIMRRSFTVGIRADHPAFT